MSLATKGRLCLLSVPLWAVGAAYGQLADGNFDALAVGTPPDCATPAGAWGFPANYSTGLTCEVTPTDYTIVLTSTFDPTGTGNSLSLNAVDAVNNEHLPNLLTTPIMPTAGQIVRVEWDLWVAAAGGGGTVYVGRDGGGGGYSNATDRGPQTSWWADGHISYNALGVNNTVVPVFPRGQWQHVRLDIHFDTARFDFYWAPLVGQPLQTLGTGLGFRAATPPTGVDRISIAHFGGTVGLTPNNCFYDNFTISVISPSTCYANCDASTGTPFLNVNDFACFQSKFAAGDSYANCDNSTIPPILSVNDFICFQGAFAAGCSAP